jgi:type I restriction enzyme S subunit
VEVRTSIEQTDLDVIPVEWTLIPLEAIASMKSGVSITAAEIDEFSIYPCYGGNGLRGFTTRFTHDGSHALIGRQGALCGNVLGVGGRFFASEHAIVVTASSRTDIAWLTFVLSQMHLNRYSESSAQPGLSVAKIRNLVVATPPAKAEQLAIAVALSDADGLIESLEQIIAKKRQIKQGAMQELLTGKKRLPGFVGEWKDRTLGEVCLKIQDGTHFSPELGGRDFLYVTSKNVGCGTLDLSSAEMISAAEHAKIYSRCDVAKGDLLITKDGASTGNAALNTFDEQFSLLSSVAMLRFDTGRHLAHYFLYQILSDDGQRQIKELMSGNAITRLTLRKIRLLRFPVAPFDEQEAIAAVLSDMDAEIDALERKLDKASQIKQGMMQELLTGRIRLI